jgi:hypothetical protein
MPQQRSSNGLNFYPNDTVPIMTIQEEEISNQDNNTLIITPNSGLIDQ